MDAQRGISTREIHRGRSSDDCESGGRARLRSLSSLQRDPTKDLLRLTPVKLAFVLFAAVLATIFTNLQPVPAAVFVSLTCLCLLAECLERYWSVALCLLPAGIAMGLSCYGYLQAAALLLGVASQLILGLAYFVHRALVRRHPDVWLVLFAFPCVHTALWALAMIFLPIGSTGSPAYNVAVWPILLQIASWLGRSSVTFLLSLVAAGAAHFLASKQRRAVEISLAALLLAWLVGGFRFYSSTFFLDMSAGGPGGSPSDYHRVSCLNDVDGIFDATQQRLAAGDTIVIHSERASSSMYTRSDGEDYVRRYSALLHSNFLASNNKTEAVVVLSFVDNDDRSWYHLVNRHGSQMSYAKNHPVPFVETDILPGTFAPSVTSMVIGSVDSKPIAVSGSICFDTDFPLLTRQAADADLFLETSATWQNIGFQHLQGHKLTAVENGQTLIKCTSDGYTGAIGPLGSIIYEVPSSNGIISFSVPRYPGIEVFTPAYAIFEIVVGCLAIFWAFLAASPALSTKCLSRLTCRCC